MVAESILPIRWPRLARRPVVSLSTMIWLLCASLPVLPSDVPTYKRYRLDSLDSLELFEARRLRILNAIR